MWRRISCAALLATAGLTVGSASAQENLVTVNLSGVIPQIARNLEIESDEIPATLQLPADMAADVCGVGIGEVGGSCSATDVMWATHHALKDIEGDPFSRADKDDSDRATRGAFLDAPGSAVSPVPPHGP